MTDQASKSNRRDFLKLAGAAAPAAVAAVAVGAPAQAAAQPADPGATRLQDTDHTRAYLASARF